MPARIPGCGATPEGSQRLCRVGGGQKRVRHPQWRQRSALGLLRSQSVGGLPQKVFSTVSRHNLGGPSCRPKAGIPGQIISTGAIGTKGPDPGARSGPAACGAQCDRAGADIRALARKRTLARWPRSLLLDRGRGYPRQPPQAGTWGESATLRHWSNCWGQPVCNNANNTKPSARMPMSVTER